MGLQDVKLVRVTPADGHESIEAYLKVQVNDLFTIKGRIMKPTANGRTGKHWVALPGRQNQGRFWEDVRFVDFEDNQKFKRLVLEAYDSGAYGPAEAKAEGSEEDQQV